MGPASPKYMAELSRVDIIQKGGFCQDEENGFEEAMLPVGVPIRKQMAEAQHDHGKRLYLQRDLGLCAANLPLQA